MSLLAGLIFDGDGNRMTPSHAVKNGTRYRYYISHWLITGTRARSPGGLRIPAAEIEQVVVKRIHRLLSDPGRLTALAEPHRLEPARQQQLIDRAAEIAASWPTLSPAQMRIFLTTVIRRIDIHPHQVDINIDPARLTTALGLDVPAFPANPHSDDATVTLSVAAQLRRAGKEMILRSEPSEASPARPNPSLIKLIVRALFKTTLMQHGANSKFAELARREKLNRSYFSRVLRLAYLAPDITRAILDGRQPSGLTVAMLVDCPDLPLAWPEQRKAFGFA